MTQRILVLALTILAGLTACSPPDTGQQQEPASVVPDAAPKIAVIGATARSGRVIIQQALDAGYEVTGLARTPSPASRSRRVSRDGMRPTIVSAGW